MQKRDVVRQAGKSNIIRLKMDATFFFERAVQWLDRYHYDKALKYFQKAVEFDPKNPVNYCNIAGILSELGKYDESNHLLRQILEEVDPCMTECYFYMANNYANMEDYDQAEKALIEYLEKDPSGQYLEESEEMMELLEIELNRPISIHSIKSQAEAASHDRARMLMEEGQFSEAISLLESIAKQYPEFIPAKNNLALAYYYIGEIDKGFSVTYEVLKHEEGNLHALCNLAVFLHHSGKHLQASKLVARLAKTVPYNKEHLFKLAMTLGILGQHESAYPLFVRIIRTNEGEPDPSLMHYAAVAAANTRRFKQAEKYWNTASRLDPESEVPTFYLTQLEKAKSGEDVIYSYHYQLPFEEQFRLFVSKLPVWESKWQTVIELALSNMGKRFDMIELYDMQTLWIEFLSKAFPQVPVIRKAGGWSGALEYLTAKMHRRAVSYREVSERYDVSISTLRNHVNHIDQICGLSEKMKAIFPHIQKSMKSLRKN